MTRPINADASSLLPMRPDEWLVRLLEDAEHRCLARVLAHDDDEEGARCTCPDDHEYRHIRCKHIRRGEYQTGPFPCFECFREGHE